MDELKDTLISWVLVLTLVLDLIIIVAVIGLVVYGCWAWMLRGKTGKKKELADD